MEMRIPEDLYAIIEKYKNDSDEEKMPLFGFYKRYSSAMSFNVYVNYGTRSLCEKMKIPKEKWYSSYTFRYTWATIAANECRANIEGGRLRLIIVVRTNFEHINKKKFSV